MLTQKQLIQMALVGVIAVGGFAMAGGGISSTAGASHIPDGNVDTPTVYISDMDDTPQTIELTENGDSKEVTVLLSELPSNQALATYSLQITLSDRSVAIINSGSNPSSLCSGQSICASPAVIQNGNGVTYNVAGAQTNEISGGTQHIVLGTFEISPEAVGNSPVQIQVNGQFEDASTPPNRFTPDTSDDGNINVTSS